MRFLVPDRNVPSAVPVALPKYDWEKSPARSSAVGRFVKARAVGRTSCVDSFDPKKNTFLPLFRLSRRPGMTTGPPRLKPPMFTAKGGFSAPCLIRKKSFWFIQSRRPWYQAEPLN